ncbi:MAG: Rpp14/Pop5 family protein [Candidatus Nanohaloarchaea archaeon]
MGDLQTLPSSLRETQRYLVFEIIVDEPVAFGDVVETVWDAAVGFLGETGAASADPWVLQDMFDADLQRGAVRVRKDAVGEMRAALALVTEIGGRDAMIHVLGVTGTMDSARDKYM